MRLFGRAFLDRHNIAAGLLVKFDHALEAALFSAHNHVRQKKGEGFVPHDVACTPDGVSKTQRFLLAREAGLAGGRLKRVEQQQFGILVAGLERLLEFELDVEIILDDRFASAGHKDEMLDPGLNGLVDHILDDWLVDDGEHFLRHRLGGRQKTGAEAGDGKHGFPELFSLNHSSLLEDIID